jgi:hypothetical protein
MTPRVNLLRGVSFSGINSRKTNCDKGHAFDDANTGMYRRSDGRTFRRCRRCERERWHRRALAAATDETGEGT